MGRVVLGVSLLLCTVSLSGCSSTLTYHRSGVTCVERYEDRVFGVRYITDEAHSDLKNCRQP